METQVQSNPKITVPPNGKVIVNGDEYEDSMIDMDDFDLAKIFKPNIGRRIAERLERSGIRGSTRQIQQLYYGL